jgi:hypothetical protein
MRRVKGPPGCGGHDPAVSEVGARPGSFPDASATSFCASASRANGRTGDDRVRLDRPAESGGAARPHPAWRPHPRSVWSVQEVLADASRILGRSKSLRQAMPCRGRRLMSTSTFRAWSNARSAPVCSLRQPGAAGVVGNRRRRPWQQRLMGPRKAVRASGCPHSPARTLMLALCRLENQYFSGMNFQTVARFGTEGSEYARSGYACAREPRVIKGATVRRRPSRGRRRHRSLSP